MEFRGINNLSSYTFHQLNRYLILKESELGLKIIGLLGSLEKNKLNASADEKENSLKVVVTELNQLLWSYLEILETSVQEFFLQIKLMGVQSFDPQTADVVQSIKITLSKQLDDLEWGIKRLNRQIETLNFSKNTFSNWFKKLISNSYLDPTLLKNLQKSKKFLSFNYQEYHQNQTRYLVLQENVKKKILNFSRTQVLDTFEPDSKKTFKKTYELLKMLEVNKQLKLIPEEFLTEVLRNSINAKRVSHIFEEYENGLQTEAFKKSRSLKFRSNEILNDETLRFHIVDELFLNLKEAHLLGSTNAKYRKFLLDSDPDPYVSKRLGFGEWIVGREPPLTKNLQALSYEIEETNRYFERLIYKTQTEKSNQVNLSSANEKIDLNLHEMSQPLISATSSKHYAEKTLDEISHLDELGTFDLRVVDFIGMTLIKLLKHDWQYHQLFDLQSFKDVYAIHIGILDKEREDRAHLNRMNEFIRLGKEVKDLIKHKSSIKKAEEEFHLSDIKGCLQDFLGAVQHLAQSPEKFSENFRGICLQLLEYRYFFGKYFHEFNQQDIDQKAFRDKFLFVDQYLDVVEEILKQKLEI